MKMEMPDVIYAIKGVTNRFDGVWDNYQWSTQKGTEYHHSRIVEALRKENEGLKAKLEKVNSALDVAEWALLLINNVRTVQYVDQKHIKDALETIKFAKANAPEKL